MKAADEVVREAVDVARQETSGGPAIAAVVLRIEENDLHLLSWGLPEMVGRRFQERLAPVLEEVLGIKLTASGEPKVTWTERS